MDDKELQEHLSELRHSWRIPGDLPLEAMWQAIERDAFGTRRSGRPVPSPWIRTILPMAAMLLLGFGLGQFAPTLLGKGSAIVTAGPAPRSGESSPTPARWAAEEAPFVGIATNYLERVTALLVTLTQESRRGGSGEGGGGQPLEYSTARARDLLATTRLLLDSPQITNPHLRDLLEDLELVLAQVVRLPKRAAAPDVYLIDQALDQRDLLPRLRGFLAENTTSEP